MNFIVPPRHSSARPTTSLRQPQRLLSSVTRQLPVTAYPMLELFACPAGFPGERYPGTRLNLLSDQEVSGLSPVQLRYAINEMSARHGADFRDPEIKRWFAQFAWYRPKLGLSYDDTERLFSYVETENVKLLGTYRDARKAGVSPTKPFTPATGATQPPPNNHATTETPQARPSPTKHSHNPK